MHILFFCKVVLAVLLLIGAGTDLIRHKIPNVLIGAGLGVFAIAAGVLVGRHELAALTGCLWAGVLSFFLHFIPWLMRSMGAGDVKLAFVIGILSGWEDWLGFLGMYSLLLILSAAVLLILRKRGLKTVPLAPFMAGAWFLYQFFAVYGTLL